MNKVLKGLLILIVFAIFSAFTFKPSFASSAKALNVPPDVLGIQMPATIEGPGLVLPDSPLFFLDQLKQYTRVFLAFNPEQKAEIYKDIAGERYAELRFMLAKNNKDGVRIALSGVSDNYKNAADELNQAKLSGKNLSKLAKEINDGLKLKLQTFDLLENRSTNNEMKAQILATSEGLLIAKVKIEEFLPEDDLSNEIAYDLNRKVSKTILGTESSMNDITYTLEELNRQASEAAKNSLTRREEALKNAIAQNNDVLKKVEEKKLAIEKQKQQILLNSQQDAINQVQEVVRNAREAAIRLQKAQETTSQINSQLSLPNTPAVSQQVAGDKSEKE